MKLTVNISNRELESMLDYHKVDALRREEIKSAFYVFMAQNIEKICPDLIARFIVQTQDKYNIK